MGSPYIIFLLMCIIVYNFCRYAKTNILAYRYEIEPIQQNFIEKDVINVCFHGYHQVHVLFLLIPSYRPPLSSNER